MKDKLGLLLLLTLLAEAPAMLAQSHRASVRGRVTDPAARHFASRRARHTTGHERSPHGVTDERAGLPCRN